MSVVQIRAARHETPLKFSFPIGQYNRGTFDQQAFLFFLARNDFGSQWATGQAPHGLALPVGNRTGTTWTRIAVVRQQLTLRRGSNSRSKDSRAATRAQRTVVWIRVGLREIDDLT